MLNYLTVVKGGARGGIAGHFPRINPRLIAPDVPAFDLARLAAQFISLINY